MKKIQKKIDKPFRIKRKNPSTSFAYNQVPRPIAHRFNDGYLLELKIILLMLAKGEYKITSSPKI